ncbi:MAG: DUF4280 domain-containing protein [Lachnospiraceae bacterium]|nr:DUF4280 domain-containing protein [Lachnospiraceae bacterium]
MGKSYLVEGARLRCMCGSKCSYLKIPEGHGYTADGRKKANCTDCKAEINIPDFGECQRNQEGKSCKGYMKLADKWENTGGSSWKLEKLNGETALTMDSVLLCKKGGMIVPETSGQGAVQKIDWSSFLARYMTNPVISALGSGSGCLFGFDPVNLNTGNFIYEKEDLIIHGIMPLSFHITYNSMEEYQGGSLGEGWHHNYEIFIEDKKDGMLSLHLGDGRTVPYRKGIGSLYTPLSKGMGLIKQESEGYHYADGGELEYTFDGAGRLLTRKDRNGNTDHFLYNSSGQLSEARGANGGALYYRYNKEGNLYHVSDHTGREVCLRYSYRVLCRYINPSGQVYTYGYNENLRLESVTTPRGIEGVRNVYDGANRVQKQITPDGGKAEFLYDDKGQCTYAKDQNGYITAYESDAKFRNIRTIYKDGEERFAYNDNDQRTLYVDKNGNETRYHYDDKGKLTGITDALGVQKSFTYNGEGKPLTVAIEGDKLLENAYDKAGRLVKTTDALGRSREAVYDEKGNPLRIIQPDGSEIKITHDERGNISSITDPYDVTVNYGYDALNRVIQITDNEGNKVSYQYDERDRLLSETNPEGAVRSYAYNASGNPISLADFDGGVMSVDYNAMGKPEKVTDKEGNVTKLSYDLAGNLSEEAAPTGAVSVYKYDRNNRLIQTRLMAQQEEAVRVVDYTYDPVGNLLKAQAGDGKEQMSVTSYEYDALNRVTAVINPVGGRTAYTYDRKTGKISSITDAAGNQRTFCYNAMGELTEETDIRGNTTRYEYNVLGKLASVTDGAGRTIKHYYLSGGRREKTVYPDGSQMSYEYDTLGRLKKKTNQNGYSISYNYDCMNRILSAVSSTGQEKTYTYDVMGNVTSVTDANGNTTEYAYTLNGRLKEVTDALGNKTEYAYDKAGRLIYICQHGQTGEADRITEYERDAFGQVECIRDALGGEECFRYDALGRMIEKTDRDGLVTAYAYTADGRPESILYGDGRRAELEYTPLRQLAAVRDWLGETRIERDVQGSPISITDHKGRTVCYEWGSMGQRMGMTYPDGTQISWKYDNLLRPTEMRRSAEGRDALWIHYNYDRQGRLSEKTNSGGYHTKWGYNETGFLEELSHEDESGILDRFRYTYDAMGNRTAVRKERRGLPEESGAYRYIYDELQRLTGVEKDGALLRSYRYDAFGNRVGMEDYRRGSKSLSEYDALNRLIEQEIWENISDRDSAIHKTYTYDRRGNLTGEYQDGELLHGYAYNGMNRLEKAWNGQGEEAEYFYNAIGQRTGRISGGEAEDYLLDLTKPYHNLLELRKGKQKQSFYWDSNVAAMEDGNRTTRYYLQDELGSSLRVLYRNGYGDAYGYDEFGGDLYDPEQKQSLGKKYSRQGENQPFGYTGYRHDDISGTYFAQAREYQPEVGRFTAEDIIKGNGAIPQNLNRYGYCWNNPILLVDLNGLYPAWLEGIYAHIQFEMEFLALCYNNNMNGKTNVYIPGGGKKGGKGFADVVLYTANDVQIYEIKPQSYYEDSAKKRDGENQLNRYINAYNNNNGDDFQATEGKMENVEILLFMEMNYWFDKERTIIYRMYEDSPGMIYYEFRYKDAERQKEYERSYFGLQTELEEDTEKLLIRTLMLSIIATGTTLEINEALVNGLFFLLIPQFELDSIKQRYTGGCQAAA